NASTGTVTLRALFANPDHLLLPGMFVQAQVLESGQPDVILAPQQAITRDAQGDATAMVWNAQGVVEARTLQTGDTAGDKWVVLQGLQNGDRLIVEGGQRVHPGDHARGVSAQLPNNAGNNANSIRGREN